MAITRKTKSTKPKVVRKKKPTKSAARPKKLTGEVFYPSKQVVEQARLKDWDKLAKSARKDLKGFWESEAKELEWFSKWKKVLDDFKETIFQMVHGGEGQYCA